MTTYTVLRRDGDVIARNLSADDAMVEILTYDSHGFEIRREDDGDGWRLWVTPFSRASTLGGKPMVKSVVFSLQDDQATARSEIAVKVCAADWPKSPEAMTDEAYDQSVIEASED